MKIAFIVDASVSSDKHIKKNNDIFVIPFLAYNESGILQKTYDQKTVESIQKNKDTKSYVEPTPGMYRDLYKEVLKEYDYVIALPQSKEISKSYKSAEYVARMNFDNVMVIDVTEYDLTIPQILKHVQEENYPQEIRNMTFDLEFLINFVKQILAKLQTVLA